MNSRSHLVAAQAQLSIQELSAALTAHISSDGLLPNNDQNNLAALINKMRQEGYAVAAPIKDPASARPGFTAWRLPVASPKVACDLLFFIPEDVS